MADSIIKQIKFAVTAKGKESVTPSLTTYFRPLENVEFTAYITTTEGADIDTIHQYKCTILDEDKKVHASKTTKLKGNDTTIVSMDIPFLLAGKYNFQITDKDEQICITKEINIVDIEKPYSESVLLESYALYRLDKEDNYEVDKMTARGTFSCFNKNNLDAVVSFAQFKNVLNKELPYQFLTIIENEDGECVYESVYDGTVAPTEICKYVDEINISVIGKAGLYTLRIKFFDEEVTTVEFNIGDEDVQTTYTSKNTQPKPRVENEEGATTQSVNAMQELEKMVGLDSIKEQLKKIVAKLSMDQQRKLQGLPTKRHNLHLAFLGNPGTGKTTVAKLLGQIYKEIGILSKGHVVVRERSSLSTQSWGSESELVKEAINKSKGGILFIDEAYDLVTEHPTDPGRLILSALLSAMADESQRDWMVILAGYTQPMERLLTVNPGLESRVKKMYFEDFKSDELMQVADMWLNKNCYTFSPDARKHFEFIVTAAYASRDKEFGNARFVFNLLENEVQPAMSERVMEVDSASYSHEVLTTIEACDIPNYHAVQEDATAAIERLDRMIGLSNLKEEIRKHLQFIQFVQARKENNIYTAIPPLHMVFTGNPGTGKSSVAGYLGDIYRSIGILSLGNVIKVSRTDMISDVIGGTEKKMKNILDAAHGNILFIDEAYTLYEKDGGKDFGKKAIETLLDTLGNEVVDMIVIMAGYPKEMDELLDSNPGLKGRFPNKFHFADYDEVELFEIAKSVITENQLTLTDGATEAIKAVIRKECKTKDNNFCNARLVVRLVTTQIIPNMASRLIGERDKEKLSLILQEDVPIEAKEISILNNNLFDEEALESALARLDSMVGLTKVKSAIHQFVDFARSLNTKNPTEIEHYPLKWSFIGNTGTGKSSVAEILASILKAMNLLTKGHTVEVQAEELYGVATSQADKLLQERMKQSVQGLLFVDGDAPEFRAADSRYNPDYLRMCLAANTSEIRGRFAVVIAEQESPRIGLAKSLNEIGINNFNQTLMFDNYTPEELSEILSIHLKAYDLQLSAEASTIMHNYIKSLCVDYRSGFANARNMKYLAEVLYKLSATGEHEISAETVVKFSSLQAPVRKRVGFN